MTALFALATSLMWGLADFGGGLLTRRIPALTVVVVSQVIAVVVLGAIVVATGAFSEAGPQLWFAVAAGLVGPVAMLAFYKALALGPMGVVSPLGSLGVAVPVGVGLVLGERPGLLQFAGILVAVAGVVLAGGPQFRGAPVQRQAVLLTLLAAFGFGAVMALIAEASTTVTGLFLALFVQRVTNVVAGGSALYVSAKRGGRVLPEEGDGRSSGVRWWHSAWWGWRTWRPTERMRWPLRRGRSPWRRCWRPCTRWLRHWRHAASSANGSAGCRRPAPGLRWWERCCWRRADLRPPPRHTR